VSRRRRGGRRWARRRAEEKWEECRSGERGKRMDR